MGKTPSIRYSRRPTGRGYFPIIAVRGSSRTLRRRRCTRVSAVDGPRLVRHRDDAHHRRTCPRLARCQGRFSSHHQRPCSCAGTIRWADYDRYPCPILGRPPCQRRRHRHAGHNTSGCSWDHRREPTSSARVPACSRCSLAVQVRPGRRCREFRHRGRYSVDL